MTAQPYITPAALAHNLRCNKILHQHVIVLNVSTVQTPYVASKNQISVQKLGQGVFSVRIWFGFMEDPNVPETLLRTMKMGVEMNPEDITYFLGRETIIVTERKGMAMWREHLFMLMARNANRATAYFQLPLESVVELGVQVEM